ncbi:hypothetical protein ACH4F6_39765 [Streptomyces sp. NPDC017936]|uniref:hypothetical protein n=1 Tax=Streptomyces sp. NPDC017936 TaxID=3365016 RepID=UPI00378B2266
MRVGQQAASARRFEVVGGGLTRTSPGSLLLKDKHIDFLGHYLFNIKASGPGQGLRPFRDSEAAEEET